MCVCETHLEGNNVIECEGYVWFGFNRQYKHVNAPKTSGGVGILIRNVLLKHYYVSVQDRTFDGILCVSFTNVCTEFSFIVIVCYLPPENSIWGRNADNFFTHLTSQLYLYVDYEYVFLCGDYNARVGDMCDNIQEVDEVVERCVIDHVKAGHGESFVEFLRDSKLCIVNGRITPEYDNFTCISGKGKSVVDYIVTTQDCVNKCIECKVELVNDLIDDYQCMSLLSNTCKAPDHSLLTTIFPVNISEFLHVNNPCEQPHSNSTTKAKRYRFDNIPEPFMSSESWSMTVHETINHINKCEGNQNDIDVMYDQLCETLFSEMDEYLPVRNTTQNIVNRSCKKYMNCKPYWSAQLTSLWQTMKNAECKFVKCKDRNTKGNLRKVYIDTRHNFDRCLRKTEREYNRQKLFHIDKICTENPHDFWKCIKNLGPKRKSNIPMAVKMGDDIVTNENVVLETWKNDFSGMFQRSNTRDILFDNDFFVQVETSVHQREYEMNNETYVENEEINKEISLAEIDIITRKLKSKKACGIDNIPNDVLKHGDVMNILKHFMNLCFSINLVPTMWKKAIIHPIPKSSSKDPHIPLNYRGISLLSCVSKVLTGILNDRLSQYNDLLEILVDEQNGFRKARSCQEHLFSLTSIIRNRKGNGQPTFVAFIDLEKAFDCIDRTLLLYRLLCYNIDGKVYKLIKSLYTDTMSCLRLNDMFTEWFPVYNGVRQGDNLSPTLFSFFINDLAILIKNMKKGIKVGSDNISILLYADDMVFIAENEQNLQQMLDAMFEWSRQYRLKVNVMKSNVIHFRPKRHKCTAFNFRYGLQNLDLCTSYKYLGCYLDEYLNFTKCSEVLSDSASRALGSIISKFKTLKDAGYTTYTKLFNSGVLSILNYGAEVWGFGKYQKCDNVMNKAMRYFLGVHKYAPTAAIQGDMGWISLKYKRYSAMLRFWNRLIRIDNSRLVKRIFLWYYDNPTDNWCNDILQIAKLVDMDNVYENKEVFDLRKAENKFWLLMKEEWLDVLKSKPKLRTYMLFKSEFKVESYVLKNTKKSNRSLFAQFRSGILPLALETGRYKNVKDEQSGKYRKTNVEERTCSICNSGCVEDECHFLLHCQTYNNERMALISLLQNDSLNDKQKIVQLMQVHWKPCVDYICKAWNVRKSTMFVKKK